MVAIYNCGSASGGLAGGGREGAEVNDTTGRYQVRKKNGQLQNVTVEHAVTNTAVLVELQQKLVGILPQMDEIADDDLHMTLYHFGPPEVLWHDVRHHGSQAKFEPFLADFLVLAQACEHVVNEPLSLRAIGLAKFGNPRQPTIVVRLEDSDRLSREHQLIHANFRNFLASQGVTDLGRFLGRFYTHFEPHVSLGHLWTSEALPDIDVSALVVEFTPSRLRNVLVKEGEQWVLSH